MIEIQHFRGQLLDADSAEYDQARAVWNGAIDRRPAVIARCIGAADVLAALRYARDNELGIAVRCGGHGVAGPAVCDDGLVIDLSLMRAVRVEPSTASVRVAGGTLLGDVDCETQAFGLAVPSGIVTHTGVGGLTLGGGIGWLMRKHGLTVDNLLGCDVVTADGDIVHASEDENPDLFWGLRGGGGNFGVVTSFDFQAHPVGPTVLAGPILWPMEDAPELLRFYRDFIADAPDELTTVVNLRKAPPLPAIPAELHGRPVCIVAACWAGDIDRGQSVLEPLRRFGSSLVDLCAPKPFLTHQSMFDPGVRPGWHYYWKSCELPALKDDMIDVMAERCATVSSPRSYAIMFHLGGAVSRVPEDSMAYSHRHVAHNLNINGVWQPDEDIGDAETAWTRDLYDALQPYEDGVYVNFLADEGQDRVRAAYGEAKYEKLVELKRRYDPDNVFRLNQNIHP